jgi:hypothetical protein
MATCRSNLSRHNKRTGKQVRTALNANHVIGLQFSATVRALALVGRLAQRNVHVYTTVRACSGGVADYFTAMRALSQLGQ